MLSLLAVLAAPLVSASMNVQEGPLVFVVEDQRGHACTFPVGPACEANATLYPMRPQDDAVDANESIRYAGVALDTSREGVPDANVSVNGSQLYVPDPIIPAATTLWHAHGMNTSAEGVQLVLNTSGAYVTYYGPAVTDPTAPSARHSPGLDYSTDGQGIRYDSVGPFNAPNGSADTDAYWGAYQTGYEGLVCLFMQDSPSCYQHMEEARKAYDNATPDVRAGLGWEEVQATNNASDLAPPTSQTRTPPDSVVLAREKAALMPPFQARQLGTPPSPRGTSPSPGPEHHPSTELGPRTVPSKLPLSTRQTKPPPSPDPFLVVIAATAAGVALVAVVLGASRFFSKRHVLETEQRWRLAQLIDHDPGVNVSRASEALGIDRAAVRYHARVLQRHGLVATIHDSMETRLYPTQAVPRGALAAKRERAPASLEILRLLKQAPQGLARRAIREALPSLPARTCNHAIQQLVRKGAAVEHSHEGQLVIRAAATA